MMIELFYYRKYDLQNVSSRVLVKWEIEMEKDMLQNKSTSSILLVEMCIAINFFLNKSNHGLNIKLFYVLHGWGT